MPSLLERADPSPQNVKFAGELARIRTAYERRKRQIPPDRYSESNPRAVVFHRELERRVKDLLARKHLGPLSEQRILDVGCGEGRWLRNFAEWGAAPTNLSGIDLLPERVARAKDVCDSSVRVFCGNAAQLEMEDRSVDIALCFTVFSSILERGLAESRC